MYKADYGTIECADEITCPHCDYEYGDSWEYRPDTQSDALNWDEECVECGKKFHVSFDVFNQNNGYTCSKICNKHNYKWDGKDKYDNHDLKYSISTTSNVYRCSKCGDIKFIYTKKDGTEYTKKEISELDKKRKKERFIKDHPEFNKSEFKKDIGLRFGETSITINTKEPEGNADLFKSINRLLSSKGFKITIRDQYKNTGQFKSLQRWNRDLNRDWLWCEAEFSRNSVKYEFFQNKYLEEGRDCGRYGFNKYELMDTKMKTEFRSIRRLIENYVHEKCNVIEDPIKIYESHGYVDNPRKIDPLFPGKIIEEYSKTDFEAQYGEGVTRDKVPVHNGDFLGAYDDHGRLWVGKLYNRCGTYKYMVHNDRTYSLFATYQCFKVNKDTPIKILPERSYNKLERVLDDKIKEKDFIRCHKIQKAIDKLKEEK